MRSDKSQRRKNRRRHLFATLSVLVAEGRTWVVVEVFCKASLLKRYSMLVQPKFLNQTRPRCIYLRRRSLSCAASHRQARIVCCFRRINMCAVVFVALRQMYTLLLLPAPVFTAYAMMFLFVRLFRQRNVPRKRPPIRSGSGCLAVEKFDLMEQTAR